MNLEAYERRLKRDARALIAYLERNNAVRQSSYGNFSAVPREQILSALELNRQRFQSVKIKAAALGLDVAISPRGHYLGQPGEAVTYVVWAMKMMESLVEGINRYLEALEIAGTLEDARDIAQYHLDYSIHKVPARLRAFGVDVDTGIAEFVARPDPTQQLSLFEDH
jgi:hypothetical protein